MKNEAKQKNVQIPNFKQNKKKSYWLPHSQQHTFQINLLFWVYIEIR